MLNYLTIQWIYIINCQLLLRHVYESPSVSDVSIISAKIYTTLKYTRRYMILAACRESW